MTSLSLPAQRAATRPSWFDLGWRWFRAAWQISTQRNALVDLDDRLLSDIGLDRMAVHREADKPFWDLPPTVWARLQDGGRF